MINDAGWSSPVAREAHNLEVVGSNPAPATRLFCEKSQVVANPSNAGVFLLEHVSVRVIVRTRRASPLGAKKLSADPGRWKQRLASYPD